MVRRLTRSGRKALSPKLWKTRLAFWLGAIGVGLLATGFALASEHAGHTFRWLAERWPWAPFVLCPLGLGTIAWLTRRFFPGAEGSGIPQTMAGLSLRAGPARDAIFSLRLVAARMGLAVLGLLCGASIGREGPTVHVGAAFMHAMGRFGHFPHHYLHRGLILSGGAAGIAAAFNTPLAGIVFAIEELSRSFEEQTSGTVLTAVVIAGITAVVLMGNYTYFGDTSEAFQLHAMWPAVPVVGVIGGLLGGAFSLFLIHGTRWMAPHLRRHPMLIAAGLGLVLAILGAVSGHTVFGSGYEEARSVLEGEEPPHAGFALLKLAATAVTYLSGIPGGIFAPSLATGAGLGATLGAWWPEISLAVMGILGMVAYLAGVVQTPLTAFVIVMEMTDNHGMLLPLMATSFIAYGVSRSVCRTPLYRALADAFIERHGYAPRSHRRPQPHPVPGHAGAARAGQPAAQAPTSSPGSGGATDAS